VERFTDDGKHRIDDIDWSYGATSRRICAIHPEDPLSARAESSFRKEFGRDGFDLAIEGRAAMTVTRTDLHLTARLDAFENGERAFGRDYGFTIPRDHL
jgi:hypothetical protein